MGKLPIECGQGWHDIIYACHRELFHVDPEYKVLQIKEKFGALRYYFTNGTSAESSKAFHEMIAIVNKYEKMSLTICEICGSNDGALKKRGRWLKTVCPKHAEEEGYE